MDGGFSCAWEHSEMSTKIWLKTLKGRDTHKTHEWIKI